MSKQTFSLWAGIFSLASLAVVGVALLFSKDFGAMTQSHPFSMGFVKLAVLGTFGELLKVRLARKTWALDHVPERAAVWGLYGLWFTWAFAGFSMMVDGLMAAGLWPSVETEGLGRTLWVAFSKSLWINFLGMFAWGMMVAHDYFNYLIANRWRRFSLHGFAEHVDKGFAFAFIPKTFLFWIPAHTFTFAMPGEWRVFIAALLSVALGFFLSVGKRS